MSPSIKLHLRHNLPSRLCLIANRQQQCFYLIISCIHSLYANLAPFANRPHFSSPQMSFFIIGLNVYGIGYFAMRLFDDELSGIMFIHNC